LLLLKFILVLAIFHVVTSDRTPHHHELVTKLVEHYNKALIPLKSSDHTIMVSAGISMIHIDQISQTGILSATAWIKLVWNDFRLAWNKTDFGDISSLMVDPSILWLPDIEVYNTADPSLFALSNQYKAGVNAVVYPDGKVLYIPPVRLNVICTNFTHSTWPEGEQQCNIKIGSWTYDGLIINLALYEDKEEMDLSSFSSTSPWVITENKAVRTEKKYDCCPETYHDIDFRFSLSPEYPPYDPHVVPHLLTQLLAVVVITLVLVMLGMCWVGWNIWRSGGNFGRGLDGRSRIMEEYATG